MHRRVNVYLDESGDLGSSPRSTRHMVVAALAVDDVRPVERALKSVRRLLGSEGYPMVEMKFRKSSCRLRRRFLEELSRANPRIAWCALDKREIDRLESGAGAVFRSLEWGDESYLRIIEDNIFHGEIL